MRLLGHRRATQIANVTKRAVERDADEAACGEGEDQWLGEHLVAADYAHSRRARYRKASYWPARGGSDANETTDGLSDTDEMTRRNIEDNPTGNDEGVEDTPVFDRADLLPKVLKGKAWQLYECGFVVRFPFESSRLPADLLSIAFVLS